MAYVAYADAEPLEPQLAGVYQQIRDPAHGTVPNIMRIHSHNPAALQAHLGLYKTVMFGPSELSRAQREMIAVVVSQINDCHY